MKTIEYCPKCLGTGTVSAYPDTVPCNRCKGDGQIEVGLVDSSSLEDKLQEIKTKINQMQADINYIKAKVG